MKAKYPSLELRWLPKPKWLSYPDIVFNPKNKNQYSGCYYHPVNEEVIIDGIGYILDNGLIEICDPNYEATLAHEFRHHLQYHLWRKPDVGHDWVDMEGSYKERIIQYFTKSETELDALLFECNYCPDDFNERNFEWVLKHLNS